MSKNFFNFVFFNQHHNCFSNVIEDGVTPEIDAYRWIPYDKLESLTHKSHLIFYEQIKNVIGL